MSEKPKISGYLGCLDALAPGWPLVECVEAFSACCSEVVVVDGGSTDGTFEILEQAAARRPWLKLHRETPAASPGRRAGLELWARARSLCREAFCWRIVPGEVIADGAAARLERLVQHWPPGVTAVRVPCAEFCGGVEHLHVREPAGRLRLSRNDPALTHDVPRERRRFDPAGQLEWDPVDDDGPLVDRTTYEPVQASSLVAPRVQELWQDALRPGPAGRLAKARFQAEFHRLLDEVPSLFDLHGLATSRPAAAEHVIRCGALPPAVLEPWLTARLSPDPGSRLETAVAP